MFSKLKTENAIPDTYARPQTGEIVVTNADRDRSSASGDPDGTSPQIDSDRLGLPWRILLVFVGVTLIWLLIGYVNQTAFEPGYDQTGHVASAVIATLLTVPLIIFARRRVDGRPLSGLGLSPLRAAWRPLILGMGCYLLPAGLGLAAALSLGWVEISLEVSIPELLVVLVSLAVLVFLYEAFPEELVFRGYLYRNLNASIPRWAAVGGQAILFVAWAVAIGAAPTAERMFIFLFMAIVIGMIRAITGDVWVCIGFHLAFQTVQQLFGGQWAGNPFAVSDPGTLEMLAFGLIPLALAVSTLVLLVREETDWRAVDPDLAPAEADVRE